MTTIRIRAHTTARTILDDLTDPDHVRFRPDKPALRQRPSSVGGGAAGVALAHIEAARTGHGPWESARTWIARALSEPVNGTSTATLWAGAPALGLLTAVAATSPTHLARARARLGEATTRLTRHRLYQAHTRIDRGQRPSLAEFDLTQGLTGLAIYHLHTHPEAPITRQALAYLVRLSLPLPDDPHQLPGWWTEHSPHNRLDPDFPGGHLNLGVAHGIAAPLAVLSLALRHRVTVDGHTDAIGRILDVLDTRRHTGPRGTWWPYYLSPQRWESGPTNAACEQRPTWCYGTPGLARAQQLAAIALNDPGRRARAEKTMADCLRDAFQLDTLADLGLCHGWAGLLHCAWRINADAPDAPLAQDLDRIAATLLDRLEVDDHHDLDPEFLDGRAGIALALHTYANGTAAGVPWDAHLALA
ncbi:hypothetical protein GCM10007147_44140 [Nocardiopsis kunsanensis]|uniref:Lanthionine synthetase n=1 Tax=Nocardiopsis kunsanensis TaxID=141693 RepID=A0A919CLF5_9ACTN|nr:lanthionine synthetase C family protein [Nocardiopsis kunsanensis]GHD36641.1 hypothetical protein GCM10007147_44140 [Nocardiopsis kunsanensis]